MPIDYKLIIRGLEAKQQRQEKALELTKQALEVWRKQAAIPPTK